jgi:uncharacterized protein (TIGR02391 family)
MINVSPNDALDLPIDELAIIVLKDIDDTRENSEFNYIAQYADRMESPYRQGVGSQYHLGIYAITEAIAWLRSMHMLSHRPMDNRNDTMVVTKTGRQAMELGAEGVKAIHRLQDNLHPAILRRARRQFLLGEYENAIFVAMKAVEVRVRKLSGFGNEVIGVDLMTKAFKAGGPLADPSAPSGEIQGMMYLFAGSYAVLRNPSGHREIEYDDVTEASEAVITTSLLMRILDRIEARLASASGS